MRQFRIIDNRDHQYLFAWYGDNGEIEGFSVPKYIYESIDEDGKLIYDAEYSDELSGIQGMVQYASEGDTNAFICKELTFRMILEYFKNCPDDDPIEEVIKAGTFISEFRMNRTMWLIKKAMLLEQDGKWDEYFGQEKSVIVKEINDLFGRSHDI